MTSLRTPSRPRPVEELRPGSTEKRRRQLLQVARVSAVVVLALGVLLLAFSATVEDYCGDHSLGCGLLSGFTSTGLLLAGGYFFLYVWTLRRVNRSYLALAADRPERLFSSPPRLWGRPASRRRLLRQVTAELAFSRYGAPVVVVGEGGAGKTTFLVELTRDLARNGLVPVPVNLRGMEPPLDLRKLAQAEFVRLIDPLVRTEEDAQRIWRRLTATGALVVLADALDEVAPGAPAHEKDQAVRTALTSARNDRLATVLASRPEDVPAGTSASVLRLGDLDPESAQEYLTRAVAPGAVDSTVIDVLDAAGITRVPFYLNAVALLLRSGVDLPEHADIPVDLLRLRLLDEWAKLLADPRFLPTIELTGPQRRRTLDTLATMALTMSAAGLTECELGRLDGHSRDGVPSPDAVAAVEAGARLGVIRASSREGRTLIRFAHTISQSYLASVHLRGTEGRWREAVAQAASTELHDALVMSGAAADDATARAMCRALLKRAATEDDDQGLACATTALEVAAARQLDIPAEAFAAAMATSWKEAGPRRKLAAIQRLEKHHAPLCQEHLLDATLDDFYPVRWHAAEALVSIGPPAFEALHDRFERTVSRAELEPIGGWDAVLSRDVAVAGWVLPGLAVHDGAAATSEALVRRMVALVHAGLPLGHEASLAQGFKLGARIRPDAVSSQQVLDLLQVCRFWYSRLVLVQTLSIVAGSISQKERARLRDDVAGLARQEPHPFVRAAWAIADPALRGGDPDRGVWEDEAVTIGTSASTLSVPAAVLLADVVILLNLTDRGREIEKRKREVYPRPDLPYCLSRAPTRTGPLFRDGCHESCPFELCPYPIASETALARDRFSEAFCQQQERLYGPGIRRRYARRTAGRWISTRRSELLTFWQEMESRVS